MEVCEEVATNLQILLHFTCVLGGACFDRAWLEYPNSLAMFRSNENAFSSSSSSSSSSSYRHARHKFRNSGTYLRGIISLTSLSVLHWFQSSEGRKRRSWSSYYTCFAPHFPLQSRWELSRFFTLLSFLDMLSERDVPTWKERDVKKQEVFTEIRVCQH